MTDLVSATLSGITLGLAAGMAPGPLMALAITQTIRHGSKEGIYVACAPLLTDIPIVLGLFFLLRDLPETVLGVLGLIGACYALFLAYETARTTALGDIDTAPAAASLRKGILTNFLSPHPYLFWITVGVRTMPPGLGVGVVEAPMTQLPKRRLTQESAMSIGRSLPTRTEPSQMVPALTGWGYPCGVDHLKPLAVFSSKTISTWIS